MVEIILGAIALVKSLIATTKLDEADKEKIDAALDTLGAERDAAVARWDAGAPDD